MPNELDREKDGVPRKPSVRRYGKMKTYFDCIPCFFKQALEAARIAGANQKTQKQILNRLVRILPKFPLSSTPPEMGRIIHALVKKQSGERDPYKKVKEKSNKLALGVYSELKKKVSRAPDSLLVALELAIAGNIIDYGVKNSLDIEREIKRILGKEKEAIKREQKAIFNYADFKNALKKAGLILYLADNAGETVFDRILIEEIKSIDRDKEIVYAVREKPIINDALIEDAYMCGIEKTARVISSGSDAPGTVLSLCSKEFLKTFKKADMIISKGQGNFEALSKTKWPIFFLFTVKCPVVARHVRCRLEDIILLCR